MNAQSLSNRVIVMPGYVAHLDADCFYVSAERVRHPKLVGKPVGVLGNNGACVIAKSYEMKRAGVKTGVPIWDAVKLCPDGVYVKRDFYWYEVLTHLQQHHFTDRPWLFPQLLGIVRDWLGDRGRPPPTHFFSSKGMSFVCGLTSTVSVEDVLYFPGMYISPTGSFVPLDVSNFPGISREAVISTCAFPGSTRAVYDPSLISAEYARPLGPPALNVIIP